MTTKPRHDVALWAGAVSFFGSLLAIGIFDVFDPDQWVEYLGALIVAGITAGGVYAKQRLDDAKSERGSTEPLTLLIYAVVLVILVVLLLAVIDRV